MMDFILIHKEASIKEMKVAGALKGTQTFEFIYQLKGGREGRQRSGFGSVWIESQMA